VPITDPTAPYHSLIYLASFAREKGFDTIEVRDTNIEALHYAADPSRLRSLLARWLKRFDDLASRPVLSATEQIEYLHLLRARLLRPESARDAIATLRDPEKFYDYASYQDAVRTIQLWVQSLSLEAFPGQFGGGFNLESLMCNVGSIDELQNPVTLARIVGPFRSYFSERFLPWVAERRFDVVGLNVTYTSQLPYALWLAREVRRVLPACYIVCGGTEISDIWKYTLRRERLGELFEGVDACVVGEGESAFVELLGELREGRRPTSLANTIVFANDRTMTPPPRITYENLDAMPTPDYALLEDRGYFSPTRLVYYSPTRGCYWNRCTFCDYGLNFGTPTSPWRQRKLDTVVEDLRKISAHGRFVYLSVDVLAPATIVKLARLVADEGIDLRWGAEVRLERHFDAGACRTLRQSGCVGISVGFESGCQRVLDAIDKGTKLDAIAATLGHFRDNDIAVQMMGFTGFPSETAAEALESVAFLQRHGDKWTVAGLGEFVLTPGAIVAMRPADFGIMECGPLAGDDIARILRFREATPVSDDEREMIDASKRTLARRNFDRPFAGGIDAAHSLFYYDRYATAFPETVIGSFERDRTRVAEEPLTLNGRIIDDVAFDPWRCTDANIVPEMRTRIGREEGRALSAAEFAARIDAEKPPVARFERPMTYFLRNDGTSFPLSRDLHDVLVAIERGERLEEAVARASERPDADAAFLSLAATLIAAGGLAVTTPGRSAALTSV
jgi:radical SAM superfamily enzyme YgiQ (UPF0313 family)